MKSLWMLVLCAMLSLFVYAGSANADSADLSGQVSTDNNARMQANDTVSNDNSNDNADAAVAPSDQTQDQAQDQTQDQTTPDTATGDDDY